MSLRRSTECPRQMQQILRTIEGRIRGVVFDSSPCWFEDGSNLSSALEYCSELEQKAIEAEFGISTQQHMTLKVQFEATRCRDYFAFLRNDPLDIPQLYLFSKDDPLCDFEKVLELVADRQLQQTCPVKVQFWNESQHCGHLRKHPQSYKEAINYLIKISIHHARL